MKPIDFFDRLYCNLKYDEQGNLLIGVKHSIMRMLCRKVSNAVLPIYLRLSHIKENHKVEHNIILSLTSFPLRIGKLWMVIESLLRQTVRAEKIIVWLSKEQFPDINSVPQSILRYNAEGVEVTEVQQLGNDGEELGKRARTKNVAQATADLSLASLQAANVILSSPLALTDLASDPLAALSMGKKIKKTLATVKMGVSVIPLLKYKISDNKAARKQLKNN